MTWRQPGSLACLMVLAATTIVYGVALADMWRRGELVGPPPWRSVTTEWPLVLAAAAVVVAWATLALTGCWRPERSWIDPAG